MGQYSHCFIALFQSITVCTYIDTICQSADDEHLWTQPSQIANKATHQILSIRCAMARANHIDDILLVQVRRSLIEQHNWCISTFTKTLWIVFIIQAQSTDASLLHKFHLSSSTAEGIIPIFHRLPQTWRSIRHHVAKVVTMLIDSLSTAQCAIKQQSCLLIETRHARQRNGIVYLFLLHSL